jgi:pSer/pThr/pTyr-binding forkhead associated (FHA) protein
MKRLQTARLTWGSARLEQHLALELHVEGFVAPIVVTHNRPVILGRHDDDSSQNPTLDLSQFGARSKGVSRIHAAIEFAQKKVVVMDLGSTNGTFLNGHELPPNVPRLLRDGDELCFAKLSAHVYFQLAE